MAAAAGLISAVANTLRLELVSLTPMPGAAAAFIGALAAGLLASLIKKYLGYPRISLTVPSIVIMSTAERILFLLPKFVGQALIVSITENP